MGGDNWFWYLFGGIWFVVGVAFILGGGFAETAAADADFPPWAVSLIGLPIAGAGGWIVRGAWKRAAQDRRIEESGFAQMATVVEARRSSVTINRQPRWHVRYRYDYASRAFEGESRALREKDAMRFPAGSPVRIKVDPANPSDSVFLGNG